MSERLSTESTPDNTMSYDQFVQQAGDCVNHACNTSDDQVRTEAQQTLNDLLAAHPDYGDQYLANLQAEDDKDIPYAS